MASSSSTTRQHGSPAAPGSCPICGGGTALTYPQMHDDRYGYPGAFDLRKCAQCGHLHIDHAFDPAELSRIYTNFYPRGSFDIAQYRVPDESRGLKSWLSGERCAAFRWVPRNVRVLDIGCGFCETLGYYRGRNCDAYGVEADENVRRVAEHFGYKVHVGLFDTAAYDAEFFDFVTLDQVIEHVTAPHEVMAGIARILKPGGTVILSTPNPEGWGARFFGRDWINWHVPYHLQQFTERSMRILAGRAGLQVAGTKTLTHSEWLFYQLVHRLALPASGSRHPFWTGQPWSEPRQERGYRIAARLRTWRLLALLTRLFDGLGLGDNHLFFLRKPDAPVST